MDVKIGSKLHGFTLEDVQNIPEMEGTAHLMRHDASGARLLYLENDDNNKAFAIGFRTPPGDDTGVFHILEHSVLCGSDKFPVKEPFVNLLKGSMQTFLNAMTFPDKTLYPVASTNEQDLFNLMDVYLDAVLHPLIYKNRFIFEQEGWHYEVCTTPQPHDETSFKQAGLDTDRAGLKLSEQTDQRAKQAFCEKNNVKEGETLISNKPQLTYNGVVFNEMKGALSDPNTVLYGLVQNALFPDTAYAFESGGTPAAIPTLTFEKYLDEHRRHYRLDNSYTILYGNLSLDRALTFLDERYFSPVAQKEHAYQAKQKAEDVLLTPRALDIQQPVKQPHVVRTMDTAPENATAALGYVIGTAHERRRIMAVDILLDAYCGSNEAPLRRTLLDADIADHIEAFVADSVLQPFVVIQIRGPHETGIARLQSLVETTWQNFIQNGLDKELIEASLSHSEFVLREHDLGVADGVAYAITSLAGWLYDDACATTYLHYEEDFNALREALNTDYYEQLVREVFLENNHQVLAEVRPTPDKADNTILNDLAQKSAALTPSELQRIVEAEQRLRDAQNTPDTAEALATLPRLSVADIDEMAAEPHYELDDHAPLTCLRHYLNTHGIVYATRYFDANGLTFEDLPYISILTLVLGKLGTTLHTAAEIDTLIQGKLGNLSFYTDVYEDDTDPTHTNLQFVVSASALSKHTAWLATLPREILQETDFTDTAKIRALLIQQRIGMEQSFATSGHTCASTRARSYYTQAGIIREHMSNVDFYRFLKDLLAHFDERSFELTERLTNVATRIFCDDTCTISFAGTDEDYEQFWNARPFTEQTSSNTSKIVVPQPTIRNEAFIVPTDVSYSAAGYDRRLLGIPYSGSWAVAARALSLDFLWNEVRVKGGAYGVGFQAPRNGNVVFYSYRDPHLDETFERFAKASKWLESFNPSKEDMDGFIVSTVAGFDTPLKTRKLIRRQDVEFFSRRSKGEREKIRTQMRKTTVDDIRELADPVAAVINKQAFCTFGNRACIQAAETEFDVINLFEEN